MQFCVRSLWAMRFLANEALKHATHNYPWTPTLLFLPKPTNWPPVPDAQCPMSASHSSSLV